MLSGYKQKYWSIFVAFRISFASYFFPKETFFVASLVDDWACSIYFMCVMSMTICKMHEINEWMHIAYECIFSMVIHVREPLWRGRHGNYRSRLVSNDESTRPSNLSDSVGILTENNYYFQFAMVRAQFIHLSDSQILTYCMIVIL